MPDQQSGDLIPGPPVAPAPAPEEKKKRRWWPLLLLLLVPLCMWCVVQYALFPPGPRTAPVSLLSEMVANYGPWGADQFNPIDPQLIGTIRADQATLAAMPGGGLLPIMPMGALPGSTQIAAVQSPTPTTTGTITPIATPTPTRTPIIFIPPFGTSTATVPVVPTIGITPTDTAVPPTAPLPPLSVQFSAAVYNGPEGTTVLVTVTLNRPVAVPITVDCNITDGTATFPADYFPNSGPLVTPITFLPGDVSEPCNVDIAGSDGYEGPETVNLSLTNAVGAILGVPSTAIINIPESQPVPQIHFLRSSYTIAENDAAPISIPVVMSGTSATSVTFTYTISNGAGIVASDYSLTPASPLTIGALFDITFLDYANTGALADTAMGGNRTVIITLTAVTVGNAVIGGGPITTTITLIDDDLGGSPCGSSSGTIAFGTGPIAAAGDGTHLDIPCGGGYVVNSLPTTISANTTSAPEFRIYELENTASPGNIEMDWIVVQLGTSPTGPWITVLFWGDGMSDGNTSLGGFSPETDNLAIPMSSLFGTPQTGINIDITGLVDPLQGYSFIRVFSPGDTSSGDPGQVDFIEICSLAPFCP